VDAGILFINSGAKEKDHERVDPVGCKALDDEKDRGLRPKLKTWKA